jgi:hypothetical protein
MFQSTTRHCITAHHTSEKARVKAFRLDPIVPILNGGGPLAGICVSFSGFCVRLPAHVLVRVGSYACQLCGCMPVSSQSSFSEHQKPGTKYPALPKQLPVLLTPPFHVSSSCSSSTTALHTPGLDSLYGAARPRQFLFSKISILAVILILISILCP